MVRRVAAGRSVVLPPGSADSPGFALLQPDNMGPRGSCRRPLGEVHNMSAGSSLPPQSPSLRSKKSGIPSGDFALSAGVLCQTGFSSAGLIGMTRCAPSCRPHPFYVLPEGRLHLRIYQPDGCGRCAGTDTAALFTGPVAVATPVVACIGAQLPAIAVPPRRKACAEHM